MSQAQIIHCAVQSRRIFSAFHRKAPKVLENVLANTNERFVDSLLVTLGLSDDAVFG